MYSIIKCPGCGHIQGAVYPAKKIGCKRCGIIMKMDSIGPLGVFADHKDMQAHIIAMNWESEEERPEDHIIGNDKARSDLSELIMERIDGEGSDLELLLIELKDMGFEREQVRKTIDLLRKRGDVYFPRDRVIRRT